jgi:hypothetical protein
MWELLSMFIKPKAAYLCARLGVADALDPDGSTSKSAEELAKELQVRTDAGLYMLGDVVVSTTICMLDIHCLEQLKPVSLPILGPINFLSQVPNSDDLYRMLRIMGIIGLLKEQDGRRFSLAPLGTLLRTDNPAGMKYAAMSWCVWASLQRISDG